MNDREMVVRNWWNPEWNSGRLCLCATGSVARGEETSSSDMDLFLVHASDDATVRLSESLIPRLHADMEHVSVVARSLDEFDVAVLDDMRSLTAQMDAVYLAGDENIFCRFREQLRDQLQKKRTEVFQWICELTVQRHAQYGETLALLEPNIKNSAGALRDIHTMCHLAIAEGLVDLPCRVDIRPSVSDMLGVLDLQDGRKRELAAAYLFLLNVRRWMHECSGHLHDTLDFDLQQQVAEAMGYGSRNDKTAVESFMRDYYRHARVVDVSRQLVFHDAELHMSGEIRDRDEKHAGAEKPLDTAQTDSSSPDAERIAMQFLDACVSGTQVSIAMIRVLDGEPDLDFSTSAVRNIFDRMLRQQQHVAQTLSRMHEMRILGKILPEFSILDTFFQHNIYHYFTADEHTLRTIRACEQLRESDEHAAKVLERLNDTSALYYALLLHDIAKPIDLQNHEEVGADLAPTVLSRFDREDIIDDVVFLVRNHLVMEQVALRRNIRETATIRGFTDLVGNVRRLDLLYVLTYADMSALNPRVLTEWKKELLAELYRVARHVLESGEIPEFIAVSEHDVEPVSHMESHEFRTAVQDILDGEQVRVHIAHQRAYSEVTVFCVDRPLLLSQLSAAFFGADSTIVDAVVETRNDVVIDVFRVIDIVSGKHLTTDQAHTLGHLIREVCAGTLPAEDLYQRYRRKWIRRLRKLPKSHVRKDVEYHAHRTDAGAEQTIIEIYAPDTFGLLYRVAGEISRFGLNVVFAKIATRVDGVVDSFYVVDEEGKPFTDEAERQKLRERMLAHITELTQ